ncbi:MAG: cation:proton antiporter [Candidatus Omnitrophica bacterium]|nr:cation:proton antiporter [Candidatus Omnitrophota bacterium]
MDSHSFVQLSLQITVMLACAVLCGEWMRKVGQPAVLGEMIGGILLGPTVFGVLAPSWYEGLFLSSAGVTTAREAVVKLGMLFFLFIVGLEINLSGLKRLGSKAASIGLTGTLLPIGAGVGLVCLMPADFWGAQVQSHLTAFALFMGLSLANSANPVIARILMDMGLLKKELGTLIMTATIFDDLINWTLFAVILNEISPADGTARAGGMLADLGMVAVFFLVVLVIGRWMNRRLFNWVKARVSWPAGFIAATIPVILLASIAAEKLGIHAFLGAFLVGVALGGEDDQNRAQVRGIIASFALSFFAPIYFVSMGLNANFVTRFDAALVTVIILAACVSKIGAVVIGARLAGMPLNGKTWAIGFGLNARGATGIILAGVGFEEGLIDERIFVAMVIMALVTSLLSGPMMKRLLAKGAPA